jgi:uncharacterized protein (TIGR02145 family)
MKNFIVYFLFILIVLFNSSHAQTVTIGRQVWMTKNLDVSTFRNGDPILQAKTKEEWAKAGENKQPAWCYYENDAANGKKYGKLYNYFAVKDPRGLAPIGFHIPLDNEWSILTSYLGGEDVAGKKMKSNIGWTENGNGNNSSKFSGLPGGFRNGSGAFVNIGKFGYFWSSTETNTINAWDRNLGYSYDFTGRYGVAKIEGESVRCLKD